MDSLGCGCADTCCGICVLAAAAGRPRIDRENAADWKPPDFARRTALAIEYAEAAAAAAAEDPLVA